MKYFHGVNVLERRKNESERIHGVVRDIVSNIISLIFFFAQNDRNTQHHFECLIT